MKNKKIPKNTECYEINWALVIIVAAQQTANEKVHTYMYIYNVYYIHIYIDVRSIGCECVYAIAKINFGPRKIDVNAKIKEIIQFKIQILANFRLMYNHKFTDHLFKKKIITNLYITIFFFFFSFFFSHNWEEYYFHYFFRAPMNVNEVI